MCGRNGTLASLFFGLLLGLEIYDYMWNLQSTKTTNGLRRLGEREIFTWNANVWVDVYMYVCVSMNNVAHVSGSLGGFTIRLIVD